VRAHLGVERSGERHDAVPHGDVGLPRLGGEDLVEHLADVRPDVLVRAQEHAQQVAAADDADEPALVVDDGQPPDVVRVHQARGGGDGDVRAYRDGGRGHQLPRGQRRVLLPVRPPAPGHRCVQPPRCAGLGGEQVGLGDDPGHLTAHLQHGHAADPVLGQQPGDLLVRRDPVHRDHGSRHHVADLPGPAARMPRPIVPTGRAWLADRVRVLRPLVQVFFHGLQCAGHVGPGGSAVQGLVVRRTEVAQHRIRAHV
jgi:hypothetical protein